MSIENSPPPAPSFGNRLWLAFKKFVIFIFRLLLTLLILGAIGAAIYFGAPVLIDEYLLKDVKTNSSRIQEVSTQLEQNHDLVNERLDDLLARTEALEVQNDTQKQSIDDLRSQLAAAEEALQNQAGTQEALEAIQVSLDEYRAELAALEEQLGDLETSLEALDTDLESLDESSAANEAEIQALRAEMDAKDAPVTLRQELELLKTMELITRARLSIGQGNTGLARNDLELANDLLNALSLEVSADHAVYLADIILRLELAVENLNASPSLSDRDLEVAWQMLVDGLPEEATTEDETAPTPTPTPEP